MCQSSNSYNVTLDIGVELTSRYNNQKAHITTIAIVGIAIVILGVVIFILYCGSISRSTEYAGIQTVKSEVIFDLTSGH